MRKIMVVLMVVALLAGTMTVCPVAASESVFSEAFEGDLSAWKVIEGAEEKATIENGGVTGKALQLTGDADTDVIKLQKKIEYSGQTPYEVSSNYKVVAHEGGVGFRMYLQDTSPNVGDLLGESDYVTTVSESGYKNMAFGARYYWAGVREAYVIIEYTGKGTVLVDNVTVANTVDGLIPNGDFEADTYSSKDVTIKYEIGKTVEMGYAKEADGNGYAYTKGGGWSSALTMKYGMEVSAGKKYVISFRYKNESGRAPCLYLYYGLDGAENKAETYIDFKYYDPDYSRSANDGKVVVTPTSKWQTYYGVITIPTGADYEAKKAVVLNAVEIRSNSIATISYFDDICITEIEPKMEYVNTNNTPIQSLPAADTTLRTRCFYPKTSTAEADDVMLISAIYEEDTNGIRKLVAVNVDSKSITATQNIFAINNTVPTAADGKTLVAESYLWNGTALKPILDGITLK